VAEKSGHVVGFLGLESYFDRVGFMALTVNRAEPAARIHPSVSGS
jgi:hypothetical protein